MREPATIIPITSDKKLRITVDPTPNKKDHWLVKLFMLTRTRNTSHGWTQEKIEVKVFDDYPKVQDYIQDIRSNYQDYA